MFITGKSVQNILMLPVQADGTPDSFSGVKMVCPGYSEKWELYVSGPLQMPYQTSGYASACAARVFFCHSSHAMAPSTRASAHASVPLMDGHTPADVPMPGASVSFLTGLLMSVAPMGDDCRSSSSMARARVAFCSSVTAPPMIAHGCGSSHSSSTPIHWRVSDNHARLNHRPAHCDRTASRCAAALDRAVSALLVSPLNARSRAYRSKTWIAIAALRTLSPCFVTSPIIFCGTFP